MSAFAARHAVAVATSTPTYIARLIVVARDSVDLSVATHLVVIFIPLRFTSVVPIVFTDFPYPPAGHSPPAPFPQRALCISTISIDAASSNRRPAWPLRRLCL